MFEYRIYQSVYDEIISGLKNIEIRLLNEKSSNIKIGDNIKFQVIETNKHIIVEVTNKYIYNNIDELWKDKTRVLNSAMNYSKEEFTELLFQIFSKEKVLNSKIVGIEFKV